MSTPSSSSKKINPWAGAAVVLAVAIALNVVAGSLRLRADLTSEKQFTLSPGAADFLAGLPVPVTLKFYYSRGNQVPAPLKQYLQRTVDMLREMERAANGQLVVELFDPKPDSDEEEYAQRYGLIGQPVNPLEGDLVYMGLVAVSGQREAAIPFLQPNAEPQLEYNITRLVHEVARATKPKIGILSNLPVAGTPRPTSMRQPGGADQGWMAVRELRRHFDVVTVSTDASAIDPAITTLLVVHPKNFSEKLHYVIDQFVMRGGRLIVFQDPMSMAEQRTAPDMGGMTMMMGYSSSLNDLTSAWGATMNAGDVIADVSAASPITFGNGQAERLPTWLSLTEHFINQDDVLLASIKQLMLPFAGGFTLTNVEGVAATPLLVASSNAVAISSFMATAPGPEKMRNARPVASAPLAVRLTGTFPTAFPDGAPEAREGEVQVFAASNHLAKSIGEGVVILVGDVDVIFDQYAFRMMNLFGQTLLEYANDNFSFMLSLVEQSTDSEALIGLRSRGVEDRAFTRVQALEEAAQARWQAEELKLLDRLQETQRRLSELQVARDDQQQVVLSPEQAAEIEEFRKIRFETQRELKNVRRNLREDIERLGINVKAVNMAAVPLLVAFYGMVRGWRRRRG